MPMTETFCHEDLMKIFGDEDHEAASELHELFELEAPRIVDEISQAVGRGDEAAVARGAHKLKSVAANVGGRATRGLAAALEDAARLRDRGEIARLAALLGPEVDALRAAFAAFVAALQARSVRL